MSQATEMAVVRAARSIAGRVSLPGDKSISHRYAMMAAIAEGTSRLANFSAGADCASTLACVAALGCQVGQGSDGVTVIAGRGRDLQPPEQPLDCGNSGSTMRLLAGILAGQLFTSEMRGDESLSRRPMQRIIEPLAAMGARIESNAGRPPLRITGQRLQAINYQLPVASAQVKSAVLLAGLFATGETAVEEPLRTRDHTELALQAFGAQVSRTPNRIAVRGGQQLHAIQATVPGDLSSAAFLLCAAAIFPGSDLLIEGLLMNPTRVGLLDVLTAMGVRIEVLSLEERHGELIGAVRAQGPTSLRGASIRGAQTAALIDELPVLAAIAPFTDTGVEIGDARELRIKESDRIAATAINLRAMGAEAEELEDGLRVPGRQPVHGAEIDSFGDHRIAMAFAVAGLRADGETQVRGADAVRISYPEFFAVLRQLTIA